MVWEERFWVGVGRGIEGRRGCGKGGAHGEKSFAIPSAAGVLPSLFFSPCIVECFGYLIVFVVLLNFFWLYICVLSTYNNTTWRHVYNITNEWIEMLLLVWFVLLSTNILT